MIETNTDAVEVEAAVEMPKNTRVAAKRIAVGLGIVSAAMAATAFVTARYIKAKDKSPLVDENDLTVVEEPIILDGQVKEGPGPKGKQAKAS